MLLYIMLARRGVPIRKGQTSIRYDPVRT
jgi:hypothetical protein